MSARALQDLEAWKVATAREQTLASA
jgi:hypothetical protein